VQSLPHGLRDEAARCEEGYAQHDIRFMSTLLVFSLEFAIFSVGGSLHNGFWLPKPTPMAARSVALVNSTICRQLFGLCLLIADYYLQTAHVYCYN